MMMVLMLAVVVALMYRLVGSLGRAGKGMRTRVERGPGFATPLYTPKWWWYWYWYW